MKSIIEEASSLSKAIENGWIRAGKPTQFSVKVFELPEKNFFGFTTKKAKIGIVFESEVPGHHQKSSHSKKHAPAAKRPQAERQTQAHESSSAPAKNTQATQQHREKKERETPKEPKRVERTTEPRPERVERVERAERVESEKQPERFLPLTWTPEIIDFVETMIRESLSLMGLPNITFSSAPTENGLKVTFDSPILDNPIKEKQFFQSYAQVIVASVRNKYKPESRSIRLMLASTKA